MQTELTAPAVAAPPDEPRSYEEICEHSKSLGKVGDEAAWLLGDDALEVETRYGERSLDEFAMDIGKAKGTVREYRGMSGFWTPEVRAEIRENCPNVTRSHMRKALPLHNIDKAVWAVKKCGERGWTVDQFGYILKRYRQLTGVGSTPRDKPVLPVAMPLAEFITSGWLLRGTCTDKEGEQFALHKDYRVVVYEYAAKS